MGKPYKVLFVSLLIFVLLMGSALPGYALEILEAEAALNCQQAAEELNKIGLFKGDGEGFSLERVPNRAEVSTMFVRLLGKESEAEAGQYSHPFTDTDMWASQYIGYMYENGLTKGVSETEFSPYEEANANMYLTFALRALGYDSTIDFQWDKAAEKALEIGLLTTSEQDKEMIDHFNRGGLAIISFRMLYLKPKHDSFPLVYHLIEDDSLDVEAVYDTLIGKALDNIELSNFIDILYISMEEALTDDFLDENIEVLAEILGVEVGEINSLEYIDDIENYFNEENFPKFVEWLFDTIFKMPKIVEYKVKNYWMERDIDYTIELDILEDFVGCKLSLKVTSWTAILFESEDAYDKDTPLYVSDIEEILNMVEYIIKQDSIPGQLQPG